jgi:ketosteroid isomerase-like protein
MPPSEMEDIEAIVRLTHEYAFLNDTFRLEELVETFTADAVFDMVPAGMGRYEGREAIRGFFVRERRAMAHLMHVTSNHIIDIVDAQQARGTSYFLAMGITVDGKENHARGYYEDEYTRVDGAWRFASRRSNPLLPFQAHRPGRAAATAR